MGTAFSAALAGTQLIGSLFNQGNPALTQLQGAKPAFDAAQQMQQQSTDTVVKDLQAQAAEAMSEARYNAQQSATQSAQQIGNQALAYDSSGVQLMGSPMLVLNQSRMLAQQSVNAIMQRGAVQSNTLLANAATTANQGRAALVGQQNNFSTAIAQAKIGGSTIQQNAILGALNSLGGLGKLTSNPFAAPAIPAPGDPLQTLHPQLPYTS